MLSEASVFPHALVCISLRCRKALRTSRWRAVCVCCMRFSICPGSVMTAVLSQTSSLGLAAKEQKPDIQAFVVLVMLDRSH